MIDSEIQFLLGLVLNHKLTADVKKLCLERIGKIEESLRTSPLQQRTSQVAQPNFQANANFAQQAPSMQRAVAELQAAAAPVPPPALANPVFIPPAARDKETGMVNVVTSSTSGGMTRGPSKVFR